MNQLDAVLVGVISTCSLVAVLFFLRYWHRTRDFIFLAFAYAFGIQIFDRLALMYWNPADSELWLYVLRLSGYVVILAAIIRKNVGKAA